MHGKGIFTWGDGRKYEGQYQFDKRHGYGVYIAPYEKKKYVGNWENGLQHGSGVETSLSNGLV